MIKPFSLNVQINVSPKEVLADMARVFDDSYRNERGTDETPEEFLHRKVEEFIFGIYRSKKINERISGIDREFGKELAAAATFRQRKDAPTEEIEAATAQKKTR